MIVRRHGDGSGRSDQALRLLNGFADGCGIGFARTVDRVDEDAQRVMRIATKGRYRLARRCFEALLVGGNDRALRIVFRQEVNDPTRIERFREVVKELVPESQKK